MVQLMLSTSKVPITAHNVEQFHQTRFPAGSIQFFCLNPVRQRLSYTNRPVVTSFEGDSWAQPQVLALLDLTDNGSHPSLRDSPWGAEGIVKTEESLQLSEKTVRHAL